MVARSVYITSGARWQKPPPGRYNAVNDMCILGANASYFSILSIAMPIIPAMRMSNTSARAEKEA